MASRKKSAGLLVYREGPRHREVFLVHPGGPFWARKDGGAWSIPKGEISDDEDPLAAAQREFQEETGVSITGTFQALSPVRQPGGKIVQAFMVRGDLDAATIRSNEFELEWPPRSGTTRRFPEVDRAEWFPIAIARGKINKGQLPLLDELERNLATQSS